ncbi:pimeloyl-ACP methyl esterase BioG family protein [Roseospira visakhapatnamensis]|uniref:Biotin synthesis protein BioG n=1 Tax=Roseospira visakhapatnamensis TaxID=390880 RepID=A0A7W6REN9_9PROT|nr:pimeloyl-ACP methyl esterase BioG family protein [Roseospira visakhapatnamensis]MBB4267037.1 biotin synthesis protein BioG [Roseospira visakhapatnamensis]
MTRSGRSDLILVFGGWALGAGPFRMLAGADDVLLVDDYTRLDDPLPELAAYDRVDLLAFSFGVASAAHWLALTGVRPARLIAVSGTLSPADAEHGIAPEIIRATADHLCRDRFAKFCRRAGLEGEAPAIDIDAARAELFAVIRRGPAPNRSFDRIWIPDRDRIVPTRAQEAAWHRQQDAVTRVPGGHVPFRSGQSWAEWIT